jgi:hypothetical protein
MATVDVRYEGFPLETDASALAIDAHAWLKDRWPDYVPSPADFDSGTIDAHARMIAELRDIAAAVPDDIFRRVAVIAGIDPIAAAPATLTATATAIDTLGYVIPAGTVFGLRATGDTLYTFAADDDVRISAGTTVSPVFTLTATEDGIGPNGLGGLAVSLVAAADRTLPWLDSAQTASVVIGGADEETISDFLTRAARSFRRRSPRLILPEDFAADALDDPAVARAYSLDRYLPGTNERQTLGPHDSTSGTFTITWNGQTTGAVPWNSTAGNIQANLVALSNIADGDVIVTGGPLPSLTTVEFTGALGEADQPAMTTAGASLTGGSDTVPVVTITAGVAPNSNADKAIATWVVDADGLDPGVSARQRIEAHQNAQREAGFLARVRAPAYDDVSVTATAKAYPGWDPVDVQARAVAAVQTFLSPAQYGIPAPSFGDPIEGAPWYQDSIIRLTELIAVLEGVDGLWRVTGPGANGLPHINGSAANYTLVGLAYQPVVMPTPGAVTITVTA